MSQYETMQDVIDAMDEVTIATNLAVGVGNEAIFIALYTSDESLVYIKVSPHEFKEMAKSVTDQINFGLN